MKMVILQHSLKFVGLHLINSFTEIGTINIEEMVLENYGQDYEELDVVLDFNVQQT